MIKPLTIEEVGQVARIHKQELKGFLPELGEGFLQRFYTVSLSHPSVFTIVSRNRNGVLGFVTGATVTRGLTSSILRKDIIGFGLHLTKHFITHPQHGVKMLKILSYPGFSSAEPELLTIAVDAKHQRRGVGRKLFQAISSEFRKRGIKDFKISVYERLSANDFYRKMGAKRHSSFDFLGEKMNYYSYEI